jgi:hypothetical protein
VNSLYSRLYDALSDDPMFGNEAAVLALFKAEIDRVEENSVFLGYLEDAGVDNWSGFEYAQEMAEEASA